MPIVTGATLDSSSSRGGQTSWPSQPSPFSGQFGNHHFAGVLQSPREPVQSPWLFAYNVARPSFHDQTPFGHTGAHLAPTGHDAMVLFPPLSMSTQTSCPTATYNQEPDIKSNHSSAVSWPEQNNIGPPRVIQSIPGKCDKQMLATTTSPFPVQIMSSDRFATTDGTEGSGKIAEEHGQMIQSLLEESNIQLFAMCKLDSEPTVAKPNRVASQLFRPCTLDLTIYGPEDLFEDIGTWFQDYGMYLQDVRHVHLDAKYCNPHKLSVDDIDSCPMVSDVVRQSSRSLLLENVPDRPDLLDLLSNGNELEETPQPTAIRTALKKYSINYIPLGCCRLSWNCANGMILRHQKQALTFMLRRERGWTFGERQADLWEYLDVGHGEVSGAHQSEEPPPFYGGIVADPMGLGKTLTMIALVATDLDRNSADGIAQDINQEAKPCVSATLIIIPPPLIGTWEEQSSEHVLSGSMKFRRHHGKTRLMDASELEGVNIVLTTYHTVSAEWKPGNQPENSVLFSELAHFIRNGNSRMARAACELDSVSRWAVTGTPIQNRLSDLAAQLKFIRVYPYDDPKQFEADISRLWKAGEDEEAAKRLKCLSACILLRRAKSTISLPTRRDMTCAVDFSREERAAYEEVREQTITKIDEALHTSSESSRAGVYVNVLQQIESLRLICDLGLHYHTRRNRTTQNASASDDWAVAAQQAFNIQRGMGPIVCLQCSSTTSLTDSLLGDNSHDTSSSRQQPQFFRCLRFVCGDCIRKMQRAKQTLGCGHKPSCLVAPVSTSDSVMEEVPAAVSDETPTLHTALPSKVEALVADINAVPADVKCLTLTVASRAYLMEPHWNPTLEEQALARIHRIGQMREVTTVRFYIRDSFEERVIELQNAKKDLARVLLSPHDGTQGDDSFGGLHKLRALL
ncbi:hypothetical protein CHGG_03758 [Chaetomium globosum CBS 148.51]|uniref:Helicase ATP-binding domain-containing protein n=1 Tax=Chaetomium globosum (strain ATCC 6205 / CBS 148.51 / DSM 1962 / NBRC 6347 / NRRL 1970) TaxID=306901 RepID=Q2H388_CHAGB|nr:uncharacterized protein CHGG_03758 [Chaetomium globosum CBS 148.51]EAQ87139.1 hypothetical protein CHGG_03758 [Chaetomium globosum CBS 148.51]